MSRQQTTKDRKSPPGKPLNGAKRPVAIRTRSPRFGGDRDAYRVETSMRGRPEQGVNRSSSSGNGKPPSSKLQKRVRITYILLVAFSILFIFLLTILIQGKIGNMLGNDQPNGRPNLDVNPYITLPEITDQTQGATEPVTGLATPDTSMTSDNTTQPVTAPTVKIVVETTATAGKDPIPTADPSSTSENEQSEPSSGETETEITATTESTSIPEEITSLTEPPTSSQTVTSQTQETPSKTAEESAP